MTVLQTARLTLRRARPGDLDDLFAVLSRSEAMRYWSTPEHESREETKAWLDTMLGRGADSDDFVIEHQGRVIGKAGSWRLPEVGFILHPDFWRRGLLSEAMESMIPHLFAAHPEVYALTAEADPRNAASLGLLQKFGFRETHRESRTLLWRDEWCDSVYLALPRAASSV